MAAVDLRSRERQEKVQKKPPNDDPADLTELLTETRILLPGTEVFLAFLSTLPFTHRFQELDTIEHGVYVCTFIATMLAFAFFVAPSAYHRIARPIHDKRRFKLFANRLLVLGLVPVSVSAVLATFLVVAVATERIYGAAAASGVALVVTVLWWIVPFVRLHDRVAENAQ